MLDGKIILVDDNEAVLKTLKMILAREFKTLVGVSVPTLLPALLREGDVDIVLLDMNFSAGVNTGNEGLFWLRRIREIAPELPVIMLTAYGDVELVVRALKGGAADFVLKPWDNDNLIGKIRAALRERKSSQLVHPVERPSEPAMIIGHSPVMMKLIKVVTKVAKTDANVLITGENGTGKEMLAREIHRLSLRSGREMVNVDMGAVSESLFESELFGHEKGAFTSADQARAGRFEMANNGTLFLDEIGDMSLKTQAKILRILQEQSFERVGGTRMCGSSPRRTKTLRRPLPPGRSAKTCTTGSAWSRCTCPPCASAGETSICCWRPSRNACAACTPAKRPSTRRKRWNASAVTRGPATCANCAISRSAW